MEMITFLEFLGANGHKSNFMIMDEKGRVRQVTIPWYITGYSFYKKVKPMDKVYVSYRNGTQHTVVDYVGVFLHRNEQKIEI